MKNIIGFIGLGSMGSGMVDNLLANNFPVLAFDIDNNKYSSIKDTRLKKASGLKEITSNCKVIILCLPNPEVSQNVIFDQLLVNNSVLETIIETSTLTPETATELGKQIEASGKRFLSAPMIGGKNHAKDGRIEFLVEGSEKDCIDNKGVFEAMGSNVRFMGAIPSATLAKLTFNLSRYANLAVGTESYRLLKKYKANIPAIYDFMSEQSLDNFGQVWKEDLKEMMTEGTAFRPSQVPKKDLALLKEMASSQSLDTELIDAVRNTYLSMEQNS